MYVTIKAKVTLPADHPQAPWKKGEERDLPMQVADLLMRERTEDFSIVEADTRPKHGKTNTAPADGTAADKE